MNINELILNLTDKNVFFKYSSGNGLQIFGASNLDSTTLEIIKNNKQMIVNHLINSSFLENEIVRIPAAETYAVSSSQRRLWVLSRFEGANEAYNIPQVVRLEGSLNEQAFSKSYQALLTRHEVLRTIFTEDIDGNPRQRILPVTRQHFTIQQANYSHYTQEEKALTIRDYVSQEVSSGFSLEEGPLIRCSLLKETDSSYVWVLVMHHIVSDGWSMGVLHREWSELYNAELEGRAANLPPLSIQYKDYAAWHNAQLQSEAINAHKNYWLEQFKGELPVLELPSDKPRPKVMTYNGGSVNRELDKQTTDRLKAFSQQQGGTMFMTLQTALNILLHKYTGQEDIVIGSPIAGREHPDLEGQIGFYVNTLALRNQFSKEDTVTELYQKIKQNTIGAYSHQVYPYDELVDMLQLTRDMSRNPLFDVMLVFQSREEGGDQLALSQASILPYTTGESNYEVAKFDMSFGFEEHSEGMYYSLNYNTDIYSEEQVKRMLSHLEQLLETISTQTQTSLTAYEILNQEDKAYLLETLNDTKADYPSDKTIVDLFEEQVKLNPENIAIKFQETELTYRELNEQSNQLAHYLIKNYTIQPDDLVGIELERSEWMVIGILAIIKSGGAYVPIDPEYPEQRKDFIKEDASFKVTLNQQELEKFRAAINNNNNEYPRTNPNIELSPNNLMYVIYTSGSTGNPKGCMLEHGGLVNRLAWMQKSYALTPQDCILQKTTFTFDVSVWELIWWSIQGASVSMLEPGGEKQPEKIVSTIASTGVTVMHFVPSMLSVFLEYLATSKESIPSLVSLQQVYTSGEALQPEQVKRFKELLPEVKLMNLYGPTEASIDVSYYACETANTTNDTDNLIIPIGKSIDNTQLYVLDNQHSLVPYGSIGEICIGGVGLARGYLNRPELTKEKFITNPYNPSERLYRTGDLGRWREDGNLEYLGRIDDQVKIRGYRIELGEIEQAISSHLHSGQALVIARAINNTTDKELIAYTTGGATAEELKSYLKERLPSYMVPNYYVRLESIPLTSNGKVDRKALPDPEGTGMQQATYIAPSTETEKKLVKIWSEVLGVEESTLSIKADFFDLGGHSIKAIKLLGQTHKQLGLKLALKELFANPTIEQLSKLISTSTEKEAYSSIPPIKEAPTYAVSSSQRRLWVLSRFEGANEAYNIPQVVRLEGSLNEQAFSKAYQALLTRHEVLRTIFTEDGEGNPRQRILPGTHQHFTIQQEDYSHQTTEEREASIKEYVSEEVSKGFSLDEGPLIRCSLLKETESSYVWVLVMHHIVSDGWSMGVLHREWSELYNAELENKAANLPALSIQYKDYAAWHNAQLQSEAINPHKDYWLEQFKGDLPVLELPSDKSRPKVMTYNGGSVYRELDKQTTDRLKAFSQQQGGTLFMTLQTALNILVHKYTGQEDIVIGSPIAGREHPDLEGQIGFYLGALPIRTTFSKEDTITNLYQKIKQNTLGAYSHQVYPYDELVDALNLTRDTSRNPLFDVWLDYHSQDIESEGVGFTGLKIYEFDSTNTIDQTKFDLSFIFFENQNKLGLHFEYNKDVYSGNQINLILDNLFNVFTLLNNSILTSISNLNILTNTESLKLLDFNKAFESNNFTIIDEFERNVIENPSNLALVFDGNEYTYEQLNNLSNQFANFLLNNYDLNAEDIIGLLLPRSEWMIIGILGTMKAACCYLPLDINYPQQRLDYIKADSNCKVVIDEDIIESFQLERFRYNKDNLTNKPQSNHLAYCIYTSGSTGNPKGVLVEHQQILNTINFVNTKFELSRKDRVLLFASFSFDASVWDIFSSMFSGASLCLYSYGSVGDYISNNRITMATLTPAVIQEINLLDLNTLRILVSAGEAAKSMILSAYREFNNLRIFNAYGPTETSICATIFELNEGCPEYDSIPIGVPINGVFVQLLDSALHLVPYGSIGEICIGGVGLARGYLNREELTKEKFIVNPYNPTERLYRTGDLGRWREDGNLEYLGRIDDQVKIRGYRIELGEIEQAISSHESSGQVVVIARAINNASDKELIAYTTGEVTADELKIYLKEKLPSYMVPNYYVRLDSIPLTSNGKVDRKALPDPDGTGMSQGEYVAPRTSTEKQLVKIWSEVLGTEEETLSITADFFDLGGHSIKAIRLLGQTHKQLGVKLALKELFNHPTIEQLSILINSSIAQEDFTSIPKTEEQQDYAVSSAQRRLWVLSKFEGANEAYNIPQVVRLEGSLNEQGFLKAYENLLTRHEVLRTVFTEDADGNPRQRILPITHQHFSIHQEDYSHQPNEEREASIQEYVLEEISRGFSLDEGPLIRCSLLKETESSYVWVLVMHHIVSDGWSMGVLHREWSELYNAELEQRTADLSPLSIQYKDYAAWHNTQLQSEDINTHKNYWLEQFKGELPVLELPSDKPRPKVMTYHGASVYRELDKQATDRLKAFSQQQGGTMFMTLQTALNILLHKYTGQEDIVIGSPIAGREHPDLEGQIGFYLGALPIRTTFSKEGTITNLFQKIKQNTLGTYTHQVYPYDELVDALNLTRDTSRNPLFDVWLDYHSQEIESEGVTFQEIQQKDYFLSREDHQTKFDLTVVIQDQQGGCLGVYWEYNRDIYTSSQMEQMERDFSEVLGSLATQQTSILIDYTILSIKDTERQLGHNPSQSPFDQRTVIERFEEVVKTNSKTRAIVWGNKELSYQELDEQSNRLANYLQTEYGINKGDRVGIKLERSIAQVVSVLGVLKTGAAYVPIDTDYPKERIAFMEQDSDSKVIIDEEEWNQFNLQRTLYSSQSPDVELTPEDAMYVIYTSGSTGTPKGCVLNYEGVSNYLDWTKEYSRGITYSEVDFFSSLSFDFTVTSLFGALTEGKTLRIYDSKEDLSGQLKQIVLNPESGWIKLTPAHINLIDYQTLQSARSKVFVLGGEALTTEQIKHLRINEGCRIYNEYGPTEATVGCIVKEIADDNIPYIGRPIPNTQTYLLDSTYHLVPYGSIGEICIGGVGLARGYLNRPELTKEKFITNPYNPSERLYRTGDLGRLREDGNMEYLGRMDDQVKIRGYRIELGEIEQAISTHKSCGQSVVIARAINNTTDKELIAYTTGGATAEELKSYLKERLPSYMVPNYYVRLESIPLTSNGKVDRKALPDPEGTGMQQATYIAPSTETEKKLVKIWSEVLGVEESTLSIKADFFDLGGHSIKAIKLLGQTHKQLGLKLALKELFANPTIEQLSKLISTSTEKEAYSSIPPIKEAPTYAVSSSQRRLWVLSRFEGANEAYNIPQVVRLEGSLNEQAFSKSYQALLTRHEVLRTIFTEDIDGNPRQRILPVTRQHFTIQQANYSHYTQEEKALTIRDYVSQEVSSGFSLEEGPLIRCSLLKETDSSYVWVLVMHHIVSDGWSMGVLHREWSELYNAELEGRAANLPPLSIQYKDYAAWHNAQLQSEAINAHKNYWLEQFKGELPVLELPSDKPRPKVMTYNGGSVNRELDKQTTDRLKAFSQQQGGTMFMTLQTALNILLHKYTGQEDIVIGSPIAGREHPDLEGQIGFYVNTLALRNQFSKEDTVTELYQKIKQNTIGAYSHQVYPYDELVDMLQLTRDMSRNPLFDVMLVFQSREEGGDQLALSQASILPYTTGESNYEVAKFDMSFGFEEHSEGMYYSLNYNTDIYSEEQVKRMLSHLEQLLETISTQTQTSLTAYEILNQEDKAYLLETLNDTKADYPSDKTIVDLFEEQVKLNPENIAIKFQETELTYRELNEQSNQLAHYLIKNYTIQPDDLVGIELERSEWMVIGILAIIKSGGAYVPIDPEYPEQRKDFIKEDASFKVTLNQQELEKFRAAINNNNNEYPRTNPNIELSPNNLMYVIYTSGSTGNPKGCMLEHGGLVNRLTTIWNTLDFGNNERILQSTTFTFDVSLSELIMPLLKGASAILVDKNTLLNTKELVSLINKKRITSIHAVPGLLELLIDDNFFIKGNYKDLRRAVSAGEPLSETLLQDWHNKTDISLFNYYGPTETSIYVLGYQTDSSDKSVHIGTPIPNSSVYLTDNQHSLVPYGSIGEICIGGVGLARGYLNRPELTKEKFITNPYNPSERLYRTGDLGRWREDGNLEYLGRIDDQVKIRGYRIELGEIEQAISSHLHSGQALVIARAINNTTDKELIAYTTGGATAEELKSYLKERLPSYMVPNYYVRLESIPLTSNGKVDRKALPDPEGTGMQQATYIAPSTETEKKLVKIWSEVLGVEESTLSIKADFFDLGGHSIKAIKLLGQTHKQLGLKLALKELFANPTIEQLSKLISTSTEKEAYSSIPPIKEAPTYAVSSSQRRLWVLSRFEGANEAYNIPQVVRLEGSLNEQAFSKSYQALLTRHEVLRTIFTEDIDGNPRQRILPVTRQHFTIQQANYSHYTQEEKALTIRDYVSQEVSSGFSLEEGPLIRCSLLKETDSSYVWVLVMHHIVSDGWSMGVLHREWSELYNAELEGRAANLPPLSIQYKDYAAWHNAQLQSEAINAHKNYWLEQFKGELPVLELPSDKPRPKVMTYNGGSVNRELDKQTTDRLKAFSQQQGGTMFMTLQTALNILLHKYTGQEDIVIGSPIAGREHPDLEGQIGFYVNTLALRNQFSKEDTVTELYQKIKQNTIGAYSHQVYPYDELVDMLQLTRDMSRNPLFDVMLVFQSREEGGDQLALSQASILPYTTGESNYEVAKFDMSFGFEEHSEGMYYSLNYNTDIYSEEQVKRMLSHLEQLLETISTQTQTSLTAYEILNQEDKAYLLETLNDTKADYPSDKTIVDLFEEQVKLNPENIAIKFQETELTYRELNEQSNQLAHYLIKNYTIQPDDLVGIELERSEWMVIGILAIIKSGGAYVPIDPEYPEQRKLFIKEDANLKVIINEQELDKFRQENKNKEYPSINPNIQLSPNNLMYVIYTSGSTGNPKGVLVEHTAVLNLIQAQTVNFSFTNNENVLLFSSSSFDASIEQIFLSLLNSAILSIPEKRVILDSALFNSFLIQNKITHLHCVPSYARTINFKKVKSIKRFISGGDVFDIGENRSFEVDIFNEYGPTESCVTSVMFKLVELIDLVPIGKPLQNSKVILMDSTHRLVPYGSIGEICIGGVGLGRGYLNRPELTKEKFIANPYKPCERLYRTGDLGRWREDGNLEYLGRIDDQVKIRGYRIELGEIEQALNSHPQSGQAVVIVRSINNTVDKELIAYTTGDATAEELKSYLKERLPSYMVPNYYVRLESIPLTSNGKVDRKALPDPEGTGMQQATYIAPSTETEKKLVKIWSEVLGVEESTLSIKADFFDLGGHSIKAIKLLGQTHKQLGLKLALKELFANPTIEQLGKLRSTSTEKEAYVSIPAIKESDDYAVSSSQRRLWVLSRFEGANEAYNIPQVVRLEGSLNEQAFSKSYQGLLTRHEVLRTIFTEDADGNPRQHVLGITDERFKIRIADYSHYIQEEKALTIRDYVSQEVSRGFSLEEGPLIRCSLLKETEDSYVWLLVMHHIVSDGWSMGVLHREWSELYNAELENRLSNLQPLSIQYKDYTAWHNAQLQSEEINLHKSYWLEQFKGDLPVLELPSDNPRPKVMTYNGGSVSRELDKQTTDNLKVFSQQQGGTLFMTLQTALNILLHKYTGQEDIVIGSPIAGREHPDLEGQIGFYVNTLALRNQFSKEDTVTELYQKIKQNTLGAYSHQVYPYDELVDTLNLTRDMSRNPLFDVMISYTNQEETERRIKLKDTSLSGFDTYVQTNIFAKFDLDFSFYEEGDQLYFSLIYNKDIYSENKVNRLTDTLIVLLSNIYSHKNSAAKEIQLLTKSEINSVLSCIPSVNFDTSFKTVLDAFNEQVKIQPSNVSVCFRNTEITFLELDKCSNQLARYLLEKFNLQKGELIVIELEKSHNTVISVLAALKLGVPFVPLDIDYPEDRKQFILSDTSCKFKLDSKIIDEFLSNQHLYSDECIDSFIKENDLMYCIYTSGSTGTPKGVLVEHRSVANIMDAWETEYNITQEDCVLQLASFSFDVFMGDLCRSIFIGAKLVICPEELKFSTINLIDLIKYQGVSVIEATPAFLIPLLDEITQKQIDLPSLRCVVFGSDIIDFQTFKKHSENFNDLLIVNSFGTTETTIDSSYYVLVEGNDEEKSTPIGKPFKNNYFILLNGDMQIVPYGSLGEICIGGVGLARGYLNRDELTKEKFINNPYNPTQRLYRTGDLGRWREDGNLEYLGRMDDQVKIRGYRIELGEIEQAISSHPHSGQAVVITRAINNAIDKELIVYTTGEATAEELKNYLKERLPSYMVANYYVKLESIPLTSNGKVDRKGLPDPQCTGLQQVEYVAPNTETEKKLVIIWSDVLGVEGNTLSIKTDFFDLGGNSLKAIRLITKIHQSLNIRLIISDLFFNSDLESLARMLDGFDISFKSNFEIEL